MGRPYQFILFVSIVISCIGLLSILTHVNRLPAKVAIDTRLNATTSNKFTNLPLRQGTIFSNQSANLEDIKKLTSEEIQLLKNMGERISKTTTQASFTALGVFLLGLSLVIYGLRLTLRATERRTSTYFKAMIWALVAPVIALIVIYQFGILLGNSIHLYNSDDPFFFVSLLLLIPASIVVLLLVAERRLVSASHDKER